MVIKLRSTLKRIPWWLGVKAATLAAFWLLTPWWVFLLAAPILFFRSGHRAFNLFVPFVVLVGLSFAGSSWLRVGIEGTPLLGAETLLRYTLAAFFAGLWFILLGIKEFFFVRRREVYLLFAASAFFLMTFLVLWASIPGEFTLALFFYALGVVLLLREIFPDNVYPFALALLSAELVWAGSFLAFTLVGMSAALAGLFFFVVRRLAR